jgi:hypothetical protein
MRRFASVILGALALVAATVAARDKPAATFAEQDRLRSEKKPAEDRLGLVNLATGGTSTVEGIEFFAFSSDGAFLALQRYAPSSASTSSSSDMPRGRSRAAGVSDAPDERPGTTLIVRRLADGSDTTFGDISRFAWQEAERTHLLAMIISAEGKTGNDVQVFDPA